MELLMSMVPGGRYLMTLVVSWTFLGKQHREAGKKNISSSMHFNMKSNFHIPASLRATARLLTHELKKKNSQSFCLGVTPSVMLQQAFYIQVWVWNDVVHTLENRLWLHCSRLDCSANTTQLHRFTEGEAKAWHWQITVFSIATRCFWSLWTYLFLIG